MADEERDAVGNLIYEAERSLVRDERQDELRRHITELKDGNSDSVGILHQKVIFRAFIKGSIFATLKGETPNCPSEAED